jgi:hypothetical protein
MDRMLHIVNGDATAARLPSSLPGVVAVWRDILVEGPVDARDIDVLAERRAPWLEHRLGIVTSDYLACGREQARALASVHAHDELVLWFEQDVFCVANLAHLAAWLGRTRPSARVSLVFPAAPLGTMDAVALRGLFDARRPFADDARAHGEAWWSAYGAREPAADLVAVRGGLPFLDLAWRLHLTRFPSTITGLGAVESALLQTLDDHARSFTDVFRAVAADERIRHLGMSDLQLAAYAQALADGPVPLVRIDGDHGLTTGALRSLAITMDGREVRAGRRDRLDLQTVDWWLGGVHLEGRRVPWRWDAVGDRLVRM